MNDHEELCATLLAEVDMLELLELLSVTVEDIIERFSDRIEVNSDEIEEYLDEQ
jgi:hypothetical protein